MSGIAIALGFVTVTMAWRARHERTSSSLAGSLTGSVMGGQAAQGGIGGLATMLGLNHSDPQGRGVLGIGETTTSIDPATILGIGPELLTLATAVGVPVVA